MPNRITPDTDRDVLLDVTRLVSRSWTARHSTGIDRVCYAYLRHYRDRAFAVVQHRGLVRTLPSHLSEQLFDMLLGPSKGFRAKITAWAPAALLSPLPNVELTGLPYINVSHTDFDLPQHFDWAARAKLRSFYFVHDLIPILHPEFSRPHAVGRHLGRVRGALNNADGIIVSSGAVADDLSAFAQAEGLQAPPTVIAPIAGHAFDPGPFASNKNPAPYFLCVGTVEPRKNYCMLLNVWRALAAKMGEDTPRLVIVGQTGPLTGGILEPLKSCNQIAPHVELHEKCSDNELAGLLSHAEALLMPSLAEGYGLPMVEALRMGTRVIASDRAIFREIGQDIPHFIDPENPKVWEQAITQYAACPAKTDEKAARAMRFSAQSWGQHFEAVDSWIASPALKTSPAYESSLAA